MYGQLHPFSINAKYIDICCSRTVKPPQGCISETLKFQQRVQLFKDLILGAKSPPPAFSAVECQHQASKESVLCLACHAMSLPAADGYVGKS